jgi:hypothetical protein
MLYDYVASFKIGSFHEFAKNPVKVNFFSVNQKRLQLFNRVIPKSYFIFLTKYFLVFHVFGLVFPDIS